MPGTEIRRADRFPAKATFVDLAYRLHRGEPRWVPPLRLATYDRLSPRHPAHEHQTWALWTAHQHGRAVGRIAACVDDLFNEGRSDPWAWVGFFESVDNPDVAGSLFEVALDWSRRQGARVAVGPGNFTTNDEIGLLVEGFDSPAVVMTTENPRYYEQLWLGAGWQQVMDLFGYQFRRESTSLSERQRKSLERLRQRSRVTVREMRRADFRAEVGRFFDLYNKIWQHNWGYVPMPEAEVRHLAAQLKHLLNPRWAFALERDGEPVAVCLAVPDVNQLLARIPKGRLLPTGWYHLAAGAKALEQVRVIALGVRPDVQSTGLGPVLYAEIVQRLYDDGIKTAEASWTLAVNHRINSQLEDMGAVRYKTWRLYQQAL